MSSASGTVVFAVTPELQTVLAAGVGLAVLAMAVVVARRAYRRRPPDDVPPPRPLLANDAPGFQPGAPHRRPVNERRRYDRREGRAVKVALARPDLSEEMGEAYVVDRSPGGVRLSVRLALPTGTHVNIRPCEVSEALPWMLVEVRYCRHTNEGWEVGCAYLKPPSWSVMMHLG
jgi:hypothetical protein